MRSRLLSDFSYEYYKEILKSARRNFLISKLSHYDRIIHSRDKYHLILRHDIDLSLKRGLKMAAIESELGISATYMVLIDSQLFSLEEVGSKDIIRKISCMGHEVGLHFNIDGRFSKVDNFNSLKNEIMLANKKLEGIIGVKVTSISFHRPRTNFLNGPEKIFGLVNTYSEKLMDWYLSDSKGYWRDGDPLTQLLNPKRKLLQLLIHPIWWGEKQMNAKERLKQFINEETREKSSKFKKLFLSKLRTTVPGLSWD